MSATKKESVRLRQRKISGGQISLYLDIYRNGKREYEYLKVYLIEDPLTPADKRKNKENLAFAQNVQAKRQVEIQNNEYGFRKRACESTNFIEYAEALASERSKTESNARGWSSLIEHLKQYCSSATTFREVTPEFSKGFKTYLDNYRMKSIKKPLTQSTKHAYYARYLSVIHKAMEERILIESPVLGISKVRPGETKRNYLSQEDLKKLMQTECRIPVLKQAFLFSCLTGIRWSDIEKMKWKEVIDFDGGTRITFQQQKTSLREYLDLNPQAVFYMGKRRQPNDLVFSGLKYSSTMNPELTKWCCMAGVFTEITFHCARHTFAVMMLSLGVEIYTVSKLLGHRQIRTTEIYSKVVDKTKQAAIAKIPDFGIAAQ